MSKLEIDVATAETILVRGEEFIGRFEEVEGALGEVARTVSKDALHPAAREALNRQMALAGRSRVLPAPSQELVAELLADSSTADARPMAERASSVRNVELSKHQHQMRELLGDGAYSRLESWIASEVRSNVRFSSTGTKLAPPAARPPAGVQRGNTQ